MKLISAGVVDDYILRGAVAVDLRTREEFLQYHIEGALNVPVKELETWIPKLPKERILVLYCSYGEMSVLAGRKLTQAGFHVVSVYGGVAAYQRLHC